MEDNNRLLRYLVEQDARDYEKSVAGEPVKDGDEKNYPEVERGDADYIRNLCRKYPKVWSNREAEEIMIDLEEELLRFGLYGPNKGGPCELTQKLYGQRSTRKPARMTPKRAELLKGLCLSYIQEKDDFKFSETAERLGRWLDRFHFRDSASTIINIIPVEKDLMKKLGKYRKIYARASNPTVEALDKSIDEVLGGK